MKPVRLYLFVGYPGAGKTTLAKMIHEKTGAVHLWADHERQKLYTIPSYSHEESVELYKRLDAAAEYLLSNGKSVIFDTNFNFRTDRQLLREIAKKQGAETVLIWVNTPKTLARDRAVDGTAGAKNRVLGTMTSVEFEHNAAKLQPPTKGEHFIKIDGTKLDSRTALQQLDG